MSEDPHRKGSTVIPSRSASMKGSFKGTQQKSGGGEVEHLKRLLGDARNNIKRLEKALFMTGGTGGENERNFSKFHTLHERLGCLARDGR